MTEEEARAEAAEAERLTREIAHLHRQIEQASVERQNLQAELAALEQNVETLTQNAKVMDREVNNAVDYIKNRISEADVDTAQLFAMIDDLTNSYFKFKNLSEASKNVSKLTDEYNQKFKFFHELRRITLGYVIGVDAHVCSDENMRKKVEQVYLQNTEYWLAYAIMAVMLWSGDEEESAKRAMSKALKMDCAKSSLFFLLVNLRFTRVDAAKKWYLSYLDRVDAQNLGGEWQYLLQAYLTGVFGVDRDFQQLARDYFDQMFAQMESIRPNFGNQVADRTLKFVNTYVHVTENEFETLRRHCAEYQELKSLLSTAEKNEALAVYFKNIIESGNQDQSNLFQRVENSLYNLINAYDQQEFQVIKDKRYHEMIIKARGDIGLAQQFYNSEFSDQPTTESLEHLLFKWVFETDSSQVDVSVQLFAIAYLKKWISKGFHMFGESYRTKEKIKYTISIDGWQRQCSENSVHEAEAELIKYYNKNRLIDTLKNKHVLIFIAMLVASLLVLAITAFYFNKTALVIGILLGVVGGFLLWRKISDLQIILKSRREKGCQILKRAIEELKAWRSLYKLEDAKNTDLTNVFENIDI